jgi:hypothetical protein
LLNNLYQVRSKLKDWKAKYYCVSKNINRPTQGIQNRAALLLPEGDKPYF